MDCLRRLQAPGYMTAALNSARIECVRLRGLSHGHSDRVLKAQEAESETRIALTKPLEDRAFEVVLGVVQRRRRNLQKKHRQAKELLAKSSLTAQERQKANKLKDIENELQLLDAVAPGHPVLASKDFQNHEELTTAAFHAAFQEALASEREAAMKLKSKVRRDARFVYLKAKPFL